MSNQNFYIGNIKEGYTSLYGINWKSSLNPLVAELTCFREKISGRINKRHGNVNIEYHFKQIVKKLWPETDKKTPDGSSIHNPVKFIWHPWADIMISAFCNNNVVYIAGPGGCGKSEIAAIWIIVNFLCDPFNTLCFATSTTMGAARKRIWGCILTYWKSIEKSFSCGKLVDSAGMIRYVKDGSPVKGDKAGIALVPAEKKKEKDALDKLKGMHNERIIFVADELGSISPSVPEAAFSNLKLSTNFFHFIGIDNPKDMTDAFGTGAQPVEGWNSITVENDLWNTSRGICLHFDHTKNPNILAGHKKYRWMPSQEEIDDEIRITGGNTSSFWSMYRGFWTPVEVSDQVYTQIEVINSKGMEKSIWRDPTLVKVSFLDPSFTNGGDRTIACFATVGHNIEGLKVLQFDEWIEFHEDVLNKTLTRTQQIISWWRDLCIQKNVQPRYAGYDSTGGGGPFGDVVDVIWSRETMRLNFGGKASELPVSAYDPTPACERYVNSVTEIWYSGKEYLRSDQIRGIDNTMLQEMCLRKLDRSGDRSLNVRLKVLPKQDMKNKYGKSPDYSDAGWGCLAVARARLYLDSRDAIRKQNKIQKTSSFKKLFEKFGNVYVEQSFNNI